MKGVAKIRRTRQQAYGSYAEWADISKRVKTRDGNKCTQCGTPKSPGVKLEVHHIIPVSRGGRTIEANLKTLCENCHERQPGHSHLRKAKNVSARRY